MQYMADRKGKKNQKINCFQRAAFELIWFKIFYPNSFIGFGYPKSEGSYGSWLLHSKDEHGAKELFGIDRWMHACFVYKKDPGTISVTRVSPVDREHVYI